MATKTRRRARPAIAPGGGTGEVLQRGTATAHDRSRGASRGRSVGGGSGYATFGVDEALRARKSLLARGLATESNVDEMIGVIDDGFRGNW